MLGLPPKISMGSKPKKMAKNPIAKPLKSPNAEKAFDHNAKSYMGKDSREGRLKPVNTSRGQFRFKDNKVGD